MFMLLKIGMLMCFNFSFKVYFSIDLCNEGILDIFTKIPGVIESINYLVY